MGASRFGLRVLLVLTVVWGALGAAQASARVTSFGAGDLSNPVGVAVDQSSHDVYVGNLFGFGAKNDKFDASGNLISPPSPFGEGSLYSGVAVNPANGQVYVVDARAQAVQTYDPSSGAKLSEFGVPGSGNLFGAYTIVQIAADAAGNVYVSNAPNNEVQEFSPSGSELRAFTGSGASALKEPTGVAIDASGDVWVADTGNNRIEEFDPSGAFLTEIASLGVKALAIDSSGNVFALDYNSVDSCGSLSSPCYHVVEYSSSGAQLSDFGAGTIGASFFVNFGAPATLAVDDASGTVYVADGANNVIWAFIPSSPVIDREYSSGVTGAQATLDGQVDPEGAQTGYRFEYGTSSAYGQSTPEAVVGSGFSDHAVTATITGLANSTTYHYRLVAQNSVGTVYGPDRTFTTFPPSGPRSLPDGRAYEMVSPPDKNNDEVLSINDAVAPSGDRFTFASIGAFAGNQANDTVDQYLSRRSATGWITEGINPYHPPTRLSTVDFWFEGFSSDLSRMVLTNDGSLAGAAAGTVDLFRREADGSLALLNPNNPFGDGDENLIFGSFAGGSSDFSHILYHGTPGGALYEWANGTVNQIPGGVEGTHAMSDDGSRLYYNSNGTIYLRQGGSSSAIGDGTFWTASTDGSRAFFTEGAKLYEYSTATGQSTLLGEGVEGVAGTSGDGSYVYFVSSDVLVSGAASGEPNLYVVHAGTTTFVATLNQGDKGDWVHQSDQGVLLSGFVHYPLGKSLYAQVSADGQHLLFTSVASLTGYENDGHSELYLYDSFSGGLVCVSCDPSGAIASGNASLANAFAAGNATERGTPAFTRFNPVNDMSSDGRAVFFQTTDALLPQDTNSTEDVYEWEADGKGTCHSFTDQGGCLYLISGGDASSPSYFMNATPSGNDVFFVTRERLGSQDGDENVDLYDARVSGGFPEAPRTICTGTGCQGVPLAPPIFATPSSVTFEGVGNLARSKPKAAAKKKHKVRRKHRKRHRGRRHRSGHGAHGSSVAKGRK